MAAGESSLNLESWKGNNLREFNRYIIFVVRRFSKKRFSVCVLLGIFSLKKLVKIWFMDIFNHIHTT